MLASLYPITAVGYTIDCAAHPTFRMPLMLLDPPWKAKNTNTNARNINTSVMMNKTKPVSALNLVMSVGRQQQLMQQQVQALQQVSTMPRIAMTNRNGTLAL